MIQGDYTSEGEELFKIMTGGFYKEESPETNSRKISLHIRK